MKRRKIFAVIATLMLLLSAAAMSGCSSSIDPAAIVETNLNANYKGEFDEEMAEYFTDLTSQEEADEAYEETIQVYIEEYITSFGVDEATLTDDFRAQLRELIVEMLTHVKYTVKNDGKTDTDYTVLVTTKGPVLFHAKAMSFPAPIRWMEPSLGVMIGLTATVASPTIVIVAFPVTVTLH